MGVKKIHLQKIIEIINRKCTQEIILCFSAFITKKLIEDKKSAFEEEAELNISENGETVNESNSGHELNPQEEVLK